MAEVVCVFYQSVFSLSTQVMKTSKIMKLWIAGIKPARLETPRAKTISVVEYVSCSLVSTSWKNQKAP